MNPKLAKLLLESNLSVEERLAIASAVDLLKVVSEKDLMKYGIGTRWKAVVKKSF